MKRDKYLAFRAEALPRFINGQILLLVSINQSKTMSVQEPVLRLGRENIQGTTEHEDWSVGQLPSSCYLNKEPRPCSVILSTQLFTIID